MKDIRNQNEIQTHVSQKPLISVERFQVSYCYITVKAQLIIVVDRIVTEWT